MKSARSSSNLLFFLFIITAADILNAALHKCANEIKCNDRGPGCASCLAPASYASGFSCAVPRGILGGYTLLDSPYCHYCESNGECLGHKEVDSTTCPNLNFLKFEEECSGPPGGVDPNDMTEDDFLSNWMGKVMEVSSSDALTLYDLSLVGSHDTTTYDIDIIYSTSAPESVRASVDKFAKKAGLVIDNFRERAMSYLRRAAKTQFLSITQQLNSGVRFLDFRINYETDVDDWYSLHFLRTRNNVWFYFEEIKQWMVKHPKEILVVWLSRHGFENAKGTDQFPDATLEEKAKFWSRYTQLFDGMLINVTSNPPHNTSMNAIAGKILTFASDYAELTSESVYALDTTVNFSNRLGKGILEYDGNDTSSTEYTYKFEQDQFSDAKSIKKSEPDIFHLVSMASSMSDAWSKYAPFIEMNPIAKEKESNLEMCNALFKFPHFEKDWCPTSLMDISLLTNYYKQITVEQARVKDEWDFPNSIYIDGIDTDGTIRTSTHLPWNQPRSKYFGDGGDAVKRYGVVWAFIERNIQVACGNNNTHAKKCTEYLRTARNGLERYPEARWDDPKFGRVTQWPEPHSLDIVIFPKDNITTTTEENDQSFTSPSSKMGSWSITLVYIFIVQLVLCAVIIFKYRTRV